MQDIKETTKIKNALSGSEWVCGQEDTAGLGDNFRFQLSLLMLKKFNVLSDAIADVLNTGFKRISNYTFISDGYNLKNNSVQPSSSNFPNLRLSKSIANALNTAHGANALTTHTAALEQALEPIISSTLWPKIKCLWVPLGNTLSSSLMCIKHPSGVGTSLTATAFVAGDYTPNIGITGDGATKYLATGVNPATANIDGTSMSANNMGIAVHTTTVPTTGNGVMAGSANDQIYIHWDADQSSKAGGSQTKSLASCRMMSVQANAASGNTEVYSGAALVSKNAMGAPVLPGPLFICTDGNGLIANGIYTGFALFDALSKIEIDMLSRFFDQINYLIGRNVMQGYCVFGDSISAGTGASTNAKRWTSLLAKQLGLFENNFAVNGSTLENLGGASGYWSVSTLGNALQQNQSIMLVSNPPKYSGCIASVMIGINDVAYASFSLAQYQSDLTTYLQFLKDQGFTMQNVFCIGYYNIDTATIGNANYNMTNVAVINNIIQTVATQFGCVYVPTIDLWGQGAVGQFPYLDYTSGNAPYGIHPNDSGQKLIYQRVLSYINQYFPSRVVANTNFIPQQLGVI